MSKEKMCQTREEILEDSPILQDFALEIAKLQAQVRRGENGSTRLMLLRHISELEGRIEGIQNQQDIQSVKNTVEEIKEQRAKFPSVFYQLFRQPTIGMPLLVSTAVFVWLIAHAITPFQIITAFSTAGINISADGIYTAVLVAGLISLSSSFFAYTRYLEENFEEE